MVECFGVNGGRVIESLEKFRFYLSLDPPRIPLKKGDFEQILPPY
jgi:hypothetical protein